MTTPDPKRLADAASAQPGARSAIDARQRKIDHAALTGLLTRVMSVTAQLGTVPIALSALGTSEFAAWAVITSAMTMLMFLDFGIGNGAMGRITEALAHNDDIAVMSWVKHSYALLTIIACGLIVLVATLYFSGALQNIALKSGSFLANHVELIAAFIAIYALVIPCSFVQRIFFAYQRAGWASVMQLTFALGYFGVVVLAAHTGLGLTAFVIGYALTMLVVFAGFTLWGLRKLLPRVSAQLPIKRIVLATLMKDGALFFLLQATVALVYNSDAVILSSYVTPEAAALYAMTFRLFTVVMLVNALLLGPLWPAISDALARGEMSWVRHAYNRNRFRSVAVGVGLCVLLVAGGNKILDLWTQGRLVAPVQLLLLMAVWVMLEGYGQCMAMLLNAMRIIRLQVFTALLLLIVGTTAKIWLANRFGLYGPLIATVGVFVLIVAIPQTYFINNMLAKKNE